MYVRPSNKELAEKPGNESEKEDGVWFLPAVREGFMQVKGLLLTQHRVYREAEPDPPSRLGILGQEDTLPCLNRRIPRWPPGVAEELLQFREVSPSAEVWTGKEDSRHASRFSFQATQLPRYLYDYCREDSFCCRSH